MALRAAVATGFVQAPVRVGAVEVAVRAHHLRLHPEAEVHAEAAHGVDERCEPLREALGVGLPVAEAARVVAPAAEPAVVEHEAFDAEGGGVAGEPLQRREVLPETDRFPGVEMHAARARGRARQDGGAHMAVQRMPQRGAAAVAEAQHRVRRFERAARRDADLAGVEPCRHQQAGAVGIALQEHLVVTAPGEMCAEGEPVGLVCVGLFDEEPMAARVARPAFEGHRSLDAVRDRGADRLHLGGPAAGVACDLLRPRGQRERERREPQHRDLGSAAVVEAAPTGDDARGVERPVEGDPERESHILESQRQALRGIDRCVDQHELRVKRATLEL